MPGSVLITGGHGNLGSYITKALCAARWRVYVLTRKADWKLDGLDYTVIEADITDAKALEMALNFSVDYCVHLASYNEFFEPGYPEKALRINTLGTRHLLDILSTNSLKHFIYFSTFHVYGTSSGQVDETAPLAPKNDYASTHLFAEYYVKQFGVTRALPYTTLRLTNSYGAPISAETDKWYLILNDLVRSGFETGEIVVKSNGTAQRDFICMTDVADIVCALLATSPSNDVFNLASAQSYSIAELAERVRDVFERRWDKAVTIRINHDDTTDYGTLAVSNRKLKSKVDIKITDQIDAQIDATIAVLNSKQ